jgi:uncharacterized protein (TIGR03032 family)
MAQAGGVLAITTYQAGKVVMVGWDGRQVTVLPRDFDKPMGLTSEGPRLALVTRNDIIVFANAPEMAPEFLEEQRGRYDCLYLPRVSYHTGELDAHDIAYGAGELWFVATKFSCLATVSPDYNLVPRWHPPFISRIVPDDRCHLNGMAMADGRPRYVTALSRSDTPGGWRENRLTGGIILDVASGEPLVTGLCMPHSPRLHRGRLWVLNSGAGELLRVDPATGQREVVCVLPGYLRGLTFVDRYALVGMGTIRDEHHLAGLPVSTRFPRLHCGAAVVDVVSGRMLGQFEFTSGCTELYDVVFLPGPRRPMIVNHSNQAKRQAVNAPEFGFWLFITPREGDSTAKPSTEGAQREGEVSS